MRDSSMAVAECAHRAGGGVPDIDITSHELVANAKAFSAFGRGPSPPHPPKTMSCCAHWGPRSVSECPLRRAGALPRVCCGAHRPLLRSCRSRSSKHDTSEQPAKTKSASCEAKLHEATAEPPRACGSSAEPPTAASTHEIDGSVEEAAAWLDEKGMGVPMRDPQGLFQKRVEKTYLANKGKVSP
jgi:hypothetical protein